MRDGVRPGKQCSLYYSQNMSVVCVWGGEAEAKDAGMVSLCRWYVHWQGPDLTLYQNLQTWPQGPRIGPETCFAEPISV